MHDPKLLHEGLTRSAARFPERPYLIFPDRTVTYAEAEAEARRTAALLTGRGIEPGDRVGLLARNGLEYVAGFYGIQMSGATVVPINTSIDAEGLRYLLGDCDAKALVTEGGFAKLAAAAAMPATATPATQPSTMSSAQSSTQTRRCFVLTNDPAAFGAQQPPLDVVDWRESVDAGHSVSVSMSPDDRAAIIYTSGSTGKPRGAVLTHRNLVANTESIIQYLELTEQDRMMVVLPFFYVYGQSLLNTHTWVGGSLLIGTDFLFPNDVVKRMARDEATGFAGVPSTFALLLNRTKLAETDLPSLRYVTQAGGAMAPELIRRLVDVVRARVFVMYGATEAGARLTYLPPADLPRKLGSIGKAIPGVSVRVLREDGAEAAVDEVGELVAQGENIMSGYWNAPDETASVLDERGFHTGDLGRRDADGYLYVVGRKREMIKCGANRISPIEIEEMLAAHPSVHEAAVIGVPHELMGEAIVAFVALRDEPHRASDTPDSPDTGAVDGKQLRDWLISRLPEYKVPAVVRILKELPKSAAGKIRKDVLREEWAVRPERI